MSVQTNEEPTAKSRLREVIDQQPEDASYDEILRELAFQCMVDRGLADARAGRTVDHEEVTNMLANMPSQFPPEGHRKLSLFE